ncbi:MAG: hypothetical protein M9882_04300 [Homoserinimonas sp.]|nr:hypothetical protein [Homoserinimonas sp.]
MADNSDRPRRPSGGPGRGHPGGSGRSGSGRPGSGRSGSGRPGSGRPGSGRPNRTGAGEDRPEAAGSEAARPRKRVPDKGGFKPREKSARDGKLREGRPREERRPRDGGARDARDREERRPRTEADELRSVRARFDAPDIPEEIKPEQLDRAARAELKTLSKENADEVARHLVMAGMLAQTDPELAHQHAIAASRRAGRVSVVRETLAITAYLNGDFALALRELRTYRRLSGSNDQLPMMVDCERGLGRPERALELGRSVPKSELPVPVQVELAIAMSGARLDLGQREQALVELQIEQLDPDRAFPWSPGLFDAYANVLEDLGRTAEAEKWFLLSDTATAALASSDEADDLPIEVFEEVEDETQDDIGTEAESEAETANEAETENDVED